MDIQDKIEIYSAIPYAGHDGNSQDDWFHVAYNGAGRHIEAVWNIETLFRPEVPDDEKPTKLIGLEEYFSEIRLHYALNYVSQRYHEDMLIWCMRSLKPNGKLQIISPDIDWILKYWLAEAVDLEPVQYIINSEITDYIEALEAEIDNKNEIGGLKSSIANVFKKMLHDAQIPEQQLPTLNRKQLVQDASNVHEDIEIDWDFDLWLMQQLYSSGAGEPQDCFKAVFGKRYLSTLLRRTQFVITLMQNNPDNPKQIEARAFKHPSRLFGATSYEEE